eukprot:1993526-Pleurochrysis_carterae.AAC.7
MIRVLRDLQQQHAQRAKRSYDAYTHPLKAIHDDATRRTALRRQHGTDVAADAVDRAPRGIIQEEGPLPFQRKRGAPQTFLAFA